MRENWWKRTEARKRRQFAALILALQACLIAWAVAKPHSFFTSFSSWLWLIASPFITLFLVAQFIRANRELRADAAAVKRDDRARLGLPPQ